MCELMQSTFGNAKITSSLAQLLAKEEVCSLQDLADDVQVKQSTEADCYDKTVADYEVVML